MNQTDHINIVEKVFINNDVTIVWAYKEVVKRIFWMNLKI